MFDEESELVKSVDLESEVRQMEAKASILQVSSQSERYLEFSRLVLNSFKQMEQKFNEMSSKFESMQNKENLVVQPRNRKCVSVGKLSVPQLKSKITKRK